MRNSLRGGEKVEFEVINTYKGPKTINVKPYSVSELNHRLRHVEFSMCNFSISNPLRGDTPIEIG